MGEPETPSRPRSARLAAIALWIALALLFALWAALIWHPWIDWFGGPRRS